MTADTSDWFGTTVISPTSPPLFSTYQLAVGAIQVLIPAVAGLTIVLFGIVLCTTAPTGTFIQLQDTGGNPFLQYPTMGNNINDFGLFGLKLPLSLGLQVRNIGAANMTGADTITIIYAQN